MKYIFMNSSNSATASPSTSPTGEPPTVAPTKMPTGEELSWIWNPDPDVFAAGPWTVTTSPGAVSYCKSYGAPITLCNPRSTIDGTPAYPSGSNYVNGQGSLSRHTAFDFAGMSGPPYTLTYDFGSSLQFNIWRIQSASCSWGFTKAWLQQLVDGAYVNIAGSDVVWLENLDEDGFSVSQPFATTTNQNVRIYIEDKRPCASNPSSGFQLYVKGMNLGLSDGTAEPTP